MFRLQPNLKHNNKVLARVDLRNLPNNPFPGVPVNNINEPEANDPEPTIYPPLLSPCNEKPIYDGNKKHKPDDGNPGAQALTVKDDNPAPQRNY